MPSPPSPMPRSAHASAPRPSWHPLVLAGALLIGARATGLVLHFTSRDPNGNVVSASPLQSLAVALPYHGAVVLGSVIGLLTAWKVLRPLRPAITAVGILLCLASIAVGQVDLGLQWFIGQRFSPRVYETYAGWGVLSSDVYAPVLHHRVYFAVGMTLMLGPWAVLAWNALRRRRGAPSRDPGWRLVVALSLLALLCRYPIGKAHGHQRDVLQPPELVLARHWLGRSNTPPVTDEVRSMAELRAVVDPLGRSAWVDPHLPLVRRVPRAPSRYGTRTGDGAEEPLPDIFLFAVESLRAADVGFVPGNLRPGDASPTPRLDALARQGVVLARHLTSGNPSPRGFIGLNVGVWDHREQFIVSGATATELDALPLRLRRLGYGTLGVWGTDPSFDNQMFWAKKWFDRLRYPSPTGGLYIMKPLADDAVMDVLMEEVRAHDRERPGQAVYAYLASAGTHEPYKLQGLTHLPPETVAAVNAEPDDRARYRRVLGNLDAQIGRVIDFLATRRAGRPYVLIVTGDHSDIAGETVPPEMSDMPHDASAWTGALLYGPPELIGPPRVDTFPTSHVDFMPTLLGLVGDSGAVVTMGTDLLADIPDSARTAVSVSGRGYRLDRGGWSLFVMRDHADAVWTKPVRSPLTELRTGVQGSPFTAEEAQRLRRAFDTWSWLIEHDRVWRETWR